MTYADTDEKNMSSSKEAPDSVETSTSPEEETVVNGLKERLAYLKWYFTSKAGWLGDYVRLLHQAPGSPRRWTLTEHTGLPVSHHTQHLAT